MGVLVCMICQKVSNSMRFQMQTSGWDIRFGKFKDQSINCWSFSILFLYKKILDSNRTEGQRIDRSVKLRRIYMVSGTRDDPPPETTLRSVYMKFNICWPSFGQVTYLTKCRMTGEKWLLTSWSWRVHAFSVQVVSSRVGEIMYLHEEKLSRLPGLPSLPRWEINPPLSKLSHLPETSS